jgi:hypothetical protein
MKQIIKNLFYKKNRYIFRTTAINDLYGFLNMIKPIHCGHDLIRMGGHQDGGYLVPNDLEGISACFSPGVSDTAEFELALNQMGIKCFLADYSVTESPIKNALIDFEKKYLGPIDNEIFMTLNSWVKEKHPQEGDLVLQMDIEGAEYGVIFDASEELLKKFRMLVIEFHGLDKLIQQAGFELINLTFIKLLKNFSIVHIHPNNCQKTKTYKNIEIPPVMEFTFLRNDRVASRAPIKNFPHTLDIKNVSSKEDITLPECWWKM